MQPHTVLSDHKVYKSNNTDTAMERGNNKKLKGVKGWLLVFVILLMILTIEHVFTVAGSVTIFFIPQIKEMSINFNLIFAHIVLTSILVFLEIVSLSLIFKKKQKAIGWVINTLTGLILYVVFWNYFMVRLSKWASSALIGSAFSIIWITYFLKAKKVKNTLTN